jgi:hypothetical protein
MPKSFLIGCILVGLALPATAEQLPRTQTKTLDGKEVVFPKNVNGKPLVLLVGFSHKSSGDLTEWNRLCTQRYWTDMRLEYYELADLQGLPFLVKPMVLHGIRRAVPAGERSHFAPFYESEVEWKQLMQYSDPENIYVVVADATGKVAWKTKGPATSGKCKDLLDAVDRVAK